MTCIACTPQVSLAVSYLLVKICIVSHYAHTSVFKIIQVFYKNLKMSNFSTRICELKYVFLEKSLEETHEPHCSPEQKF